MICLAPLAGVTSMPVREFFSRLGAELTHTEMISCAGIKSRAPSKMINQICRLQSKFFRQSENKSGRARCSVVFEKF